MVFQVNNQICQCQNQKPTNMRIAQSVVVNDELQRGLCAQRPNATFRVVEDVLRDICLKTTQ